MFSATLSKEIRPVCKKFMQDPMEVYVDDEAKLTLHGLQQHYVKLKDAEKNRKLFELLDVLEFNQVYFRKVCTTLHGSRTVVDRAKFPRNCNSPRNASRRASLQIPTIQGFPKENSHSHQSIWSWYGHRTSQHRFQLRHARRHRHLPTQSCPSWTFRYQRFGHNLCL